MLNEVAGTSTTVAPPTPIVIKSGTTIPITEGTTQQFTANIPVSWSLAPGSVGWIDPLTGVYTAPAYITAKNTVAGCQARPNDDIFNTPVDALPVHPNSAAWIASLKSQDMDYEPAWGVSTFDANTPTPVAKFNYTPQWNGPFPVPAWPELRKEGGNFATGQSSGGGGDHHYTAVNLSNCSYVETYNYTPGALSASGTKYSGLTWALPNGATDAAGMELSPVTLHLAELEAGQINHALRFSISNSVIAPKMVWPATALSTYPWAPNGMPYGTRLRLKKGVLNPISHSEMAQTLINQLMTYGIILTDGANYMSITVDQDLKEDPQAWAAIKEVINAINAVGGMGAYEVVDESSLKVGNGSGAVNPANPYVQPATFAQVVATDLAHPTNQATSRILSQGVGIGVPDPAITVASGATVQLKAWTSGTTSNGDVQWFKNTVGTITAAGVYTAPKVTAPTRTVVTAYSVENPGAVQPVVLTILPLASDGSLRVSTIVGSAYFADAYPGSTFTDSNKTTWWSDPGFFAAASYNYCDTGGVGGFNGGWCSYGEDGTHDFLVPNGNYKVTLYFAVPSGDAGKIAAWNIGAQGQWTQTGFNIVTASNNAKQLASVSLPARVTDNHLSFTLSDTIVDNKALGVMMSGFTVAPDSSAPHLALSDAHGNTTASTIPVNTNMQFNAVGWYMPNAVNWSLSPQIGTISPGGLYTAPATAQNATLTLTATSQSDSTKSASITINLVEGNSP